MTTSMLQEQRRDRNAGVITTLVFHLLLGILFLFIGLKHFDPPLPEEMVEVAMADYGTTDEGGGDEPTPDPGAQQSATPSTPQDDPEDVATDEASDVEVVRPKDPKPKPRTDPKPVKPKEPKIDTRLNEALNTWNKPGSEPSDGPDKKPGDPGVETGKPGGIGMMRGDGWELRGSGRGLARGPDLSERPELQNATWVEVKVIVDRAGSVLRVSVANTGTSDVAIQNVALRAAKTCRFIPLADGPPEQAHYIKLRFFPG